jgi:exonuclease III
MPVTGVKEYGDRIDYIFVPRGTTVIGSGIIYYHADGSYPSNHFPLLCEFELE